MDFETMQAERQTRLAKREASAISAMLDRQADRSPRISGRTDTHREIAESGTITIRELARMWGLSVHVPTAKQSRKVEIIRIWCEMHA